MSCFLSFVFMGLLLSVSSPASAVLAPNMSACNLPSSLPKDESPFNCCAPFADYPLRLFTPNSSSSPLRVRRPAHLVSQAYAEKLVRAYALMKALPADDPRSFTQQANIHCAYCNAVYNEMNSSQLFRIHGTWLFFAFHRWYLYFHERILAKLLEEDDFALPFWNYDHPDGATIPWLYSTYNLTLVDSLRDTLHVATHAPAAIDYTWDTDDRSPEQQLRENANAMFRCLIRDATAKDLFFGGAYREGKPFPSNGYGTVEKGPHNAIHYWMGQKSQVGWKDMGSLYAAARDPLFYAHHAEIDRFWELWKAMLGNHDIEDEDYLESELAFYDENAELVRVKTRDSLNTTVLGYVYEDVENLWMEAIPERRSAGPVKLMGNETMCVEGEEIKQPCSIVMERDALGAKGKEEYMKLRVGYVVNEPIQLNIFINMPSANKETDSGCEEYYDFVAIPPVFVTGESASDVGGRNATTTLETMIGLLRTRLAALELSEATSFVVTFVPHFGHNAARAYISLLHASIATLDDHFYSTS